MKIEEIVKEYLDLHIELHGADFTWEDVLKDIKLSFDFDFEDFTIINEIEKQIKEHKDSSKRYGLAIGRFQPFHLGHNAIIQDIIRDGRIPIIIIGGINKDDDRHPLTFKECSWLIRTMYPISSIKFIGLEDKDNWNEWYQSVKDGISNLGIKKEQITLYAHNKNEDLKDFEYNDIHYQNESYTKLFELNNVNIKYVDEFTCKLGHTVHASDIRKDEEVAKRNLDARVYLTLKEKGWWCS